MFRLALCTPHATYAPTLSVKPLTSFPTPHCCAVHGKRTHDRPHMSRRRTRNAQKGDRMEHSGWSFVDTCATCEKHVGGMPESVRDQRCLTPGTVTDVTVVHTVVRAAPSRGGPGSESLSESLSFVIVIITSPSQFGTSQQLHFHT